MLLKAVSYSQEPRSTKYELRVRSSGGAPNLKIARKLGGENKKKGAYFPSAPHGTDLAGKLFLNISPATDVRGYSSSNERQVPSPPLLEIFTINPKQLLLGETMGGPEHDGCPHKISIQQAREGFFKASFMFPRKLRFHHRSTIPIA